MPAWLEVGRQPMEKVALPIRKRVSMRTNRRP